MPFENDLILARNWDAGKSQIQTALNELDECCVYTGMSTSELESNYLTVGFGGVVPTRCDWLIVVLTDDNVLMSFDDGVTWVNVFDPTMTGGATLVPTGLVVEYAGDENNVPTGYLICDGDEVDRTTYADLYAVTGDFYGAGNGTTTFNLPDLRGRSPNGVNVAGLPNGNNATFPNKARGTTGGTETHQLTTAELASHVHAGMRPTGSLFQCEFVFTNVNATSAAGNTDSNGSNTAHENEQPFRVVNYIIKT